MRSFSHWRWRLDEMFARINGERHDLWRAVDHEGEILESFVTKTRDKASELKFLKKFSAAHTASHNHLSLQRHFINRDRFRTQRSAALAEWRSLAASASRLSGFVRSRGAPVRYLAHMNSFHSNERISPSKPGTKHLDPDDPSFPA